MEKSSSNTLQEIFTCTRCGFCCQGETTVSLDEQDQERMITKLGLSREEVQEKYWRVTGNIVQMKTVDGHCIFYDKNQGCTVHEGRPWRCGQWPLHPSMLDDENNFLTIRASCPGINQEMDYTAFCAKLRSLIENAEKKLTC